MYHHHFIFNQLDPLLPLNPLPLMIPPIPTRPIRLQPPILNREHIHKHALLIHRLAEQFPAVPGARAQLLARAMHRLLLPLQVGEQFAALVRLVQLPGAVDCPVAEVASAREAERARGPGVPEEIADKGCSTVYILGIFILGEG